VAALSAPRDWEAARQAAYQDALAFDVDGVCRAWHRLILGQPASGEAAPQLQDSGTRSAG
jgi:hypothetical protein